MPGKLELDITYLRNTLNYELTDELNLVWLAGYEDMQRQSAQDIEAGLDVWDGDVFPRRHRRPLLFDRAAVAVR
ncbi:MAG: hypothetical protein U5L02_08500 [Rheinheimera sp.]|nr:hypothetical protein [Rheinheimera sp.]